MTCRVPVRSKGQVVDFALVDEADYDDLAQWAWGMNHGGYAKRTAWIDGKYHTVTMARVIMGLPLGDARVVDHVNRIRLDNRRENLRISTHRVNARNRTREGLSSKFFGVTWSARTGRWQAQVDRVYLGQFDDELDAAQAAIDHLRVHR